MLKVLDTGGLIAYILRGIAGNGGRMNVDTSPNGRCMHSTTHRVSLKSHIRQAWLIFLYAPILIIYPDVRDVCPRAYPTFRPGKKEIDVTTEGATETIEDTQYEFARAIERLVECGFLRRVS